MLLLIIFLITCVSQTKHHLELSHFMSDSVPSLLWKPKRRFSPAFEERQCRDRYKGGWNDVSRCSFVLWRLIKVSRCAFSLPRMFHKLCYDKKKSASCGYPLPLALWCLSVSVNHVIKQIRRRRSDWYFSDFLFFYFVVFSRLRWSCESLNIKRAYDEFSEKEL